MSSLLSLKRIARPGTRIPTRAGRKRRPVREEQRPEQRWQLLGERAGLTISDRESLKALERENVELKRANEILRKASAFLLIMDFTRSDPICAFMVTNNIDEAAELIRDENPRLKKPVEASPVALS